MTSNAPRDAVGRFPCPAPVRSTSASGPTPPRWPGEDRSLRPLGHTTASDAVLARVVDVIRSPVRGGDAVGDRLRDVVTVGAPSSQGLWFRPSRPVAGYNGAAGHGRPEPAGGDNGRATSTAQRPVRGGRSAASPEA
ncbi:hypothetical protein GCM10027294_26050 [Marinactinospora endophytica]